MLRRKAIETNKTKRSITDGSVSPLIGKKSKLSNYKWKRMPHYRCHIYKMINKKISWKCYSNKADSFDEMNKLFKDKNDKINIKMKILNIFILKIGFMMEKISCKLLHGKSHQTCKERIFTKYFQEIPEWWNSSLFILWDQTVW